MANQSVLGLYSNADTAAEAARNLRGAGFTSDDYEVMTGNPYPEGAFGEHVKKNKLFRFSLFGAFIGFITAFLFVFATQAAFPLVTGGKPHPRHSREHDHHVRIHTAVRDDLHSHRRHL